MFSLKTFESFSQKLLRSGFCCCIIEIYVAHLNCTLLKAAELARRLSVSRASVSEALAKLVAKKVIRYNRYEPISLTDYGLEKAKEVYEKHHTLSNFFEVVLGIDKSEASENACKIEHIVSQNVLFKMNEFTEFCKTHKELLEKFKTKKDSETSPE